MNHVAHDGCSLNVCCLVSEWMINDGDRHASKNSDLGQKERNAKSLLNDL